MKALNDWTDKPYIIEITMFAKCIHIFNEIPIKFSLEFFIKFEKLVLKCVWKDKGQKTKQKNTKILLNNKVDVILSDIKTY